MYVAELMHLKLALKLINDYWTANYSKEPNPIGQQVLERNKEINFKAGLRNLA